MELKSRFCVLVWPFIGPIFCFQGACDWLFPSSHCLYITSILKICQQKWTTFCIYRLPTKSYRLATLKLCVQNVHTFKKSKYNLNATWKQPENTPNRTNVPKPNTCRVWRGLGFKKFSKIWKLHSSRNWSFWTRKKLHRDLESQRNQIKTQKSKSENPPV